MGGSPSLRTFGVHLLIQEQLDLGKEIKVYILFSTEIKITIRGIHTSMEVISYPRIRDIEKLCREDYKNMYNIYPPWNFQENHEEFPRHIKIAFKNQVMNKFVLCKISIFVIVSILDVIIFYPLKLH